MARALLPLKDLVAAKTRLGGLMGPSERRALARAMARDVLSVLTAHPRISSVTLVSDDPEAPLLAATHGASFCAERELGRQGLNGVLAAASDRLLDGTSEALVVLHGDLPLLTTEDITTVLLEQQVSGGLVIGCDQAGTGTNLLAFTAASRPRYQFGPDSCASHQRFARAAGIPVRILQRLGIGLDVDEPADVAALLDIINRRLAPVGNFSRELLCDRGLAARLQLALHSLQPDSALWNGNSITYE